MPVGVPESEVRAAADAVLARGERPTVERVRAELGRGSPARVGKLLEAWWEDLAKRLASAKLLPELPAEAAQAFAEAWRLACDAGRASAERALAGEREALAAKDRALEQARTALEDQRDQALDAARESQRALEHAQARNGDLERLIASQGTQLEDLRGERQGLLQDLATTRSALERAEASLDAARREAAEERQRSASHVRTVEDRAHAEVDRAREALKRKERELVEQRRLAAAEASASQKQLNEALRALQAANANLARLQAAEQSLRKRLEQSGKRAKTAARASRVPKRKGAKRSEAATP